MNPVALVAQAMIAYFEGDIRRINYLFKVYSFAKVIGELENLDASTQLMLEIAALTHDIGIKVSEAKYHSASGEYQQLEGPNEAEKLLSTLDMDTGKVARV